MQLNSTVVGTGLAQRMMIFMAAILKTKPIYFSVFSQLSRMRSARKRGYSAGFLNLWHRKISTNLRGLKALCQVVSTIRGEAN